MAGASYRIGTLARLTGVSAHALRIWERRYQAFAPARAPKGARLYSDADVERVSLLKGLIADGHPIGSIAQLSAGELRALAKKTKKQHEARTGAADDMAALARHLVLAGTAFEPERARDTLHRARTLLSARDVVLGVIAPALEELGKNWQRDGMCILGEHAVSALVRTELGLLASAGARNPGPPIVCTTPEGERHELGALLVAAMVSAHGGRPLYLGPDLPAAQIVDAARLSQARAVALSVVSLEPKLAERELSLVARALPSGLLLLLGGRGLALLERLPARATVFDRLTALGAWLERTAPAFEPALEH
jgi:DNA-binding transcriptional MerR regulator